MYYPNLATVRVHHLGDTRSLDQIIGLANHGSPLIIAFFPTRYPQGHLTGGNGDEMVLADSSIWHRQALSHQHFQAWWGGFSAVVTLRGGSS